MVRSQQQALSHLAASVEQLASSAAKNKRLRIEANLERDKMLINFKRDEAQKNREHNIQMTQIFANAMMHSYRTPLLSNWSEYPNAKFQTSSGVQFSQHAVPLAVSPPQHSSSAPYQFPNIEQSNYDAIKYSYNPGNAQRLKYCEGK